MNAIPQNQPQWPDLDKAFAQVQAHAARLSTVFHQDFLAELFHVEEHPEAAPSIFVMSDGGAMAQVFVTETGYLIQYEWEEFTDAEAGTLEELLKPNRPTPEPANDNAVAAVAKGADAR